MNGPSLVLDRNRKECSNAVLRHEAYMTNERTCARTCESGFYCFDILRPNANTVLQPAIFPRPLKFTRKSMKGWFGIGYIVFICAGPDIPVIFSYSLSLSASPHMCCIFLHDDVCCCCCSCRRYCDSTALRHSKHFRTLVSVLSEELATEFNKKNTRIQPLHAQCKTK